jgi:hypothetical protein
VRLVRLTGIKLMKRHILISLLLLLTLFLPSCSAFQETPLLQTTSKGYPPEPYPEAMITFRVELPAPVQAGEKVYLTVLDEVTGLAFNQQRYAMQAEDARHFIVILPFPMQSMIKYRYALERERVVSEYLSDGRSVRYRLYHVVNPGIVQDVVSRWADTVYSLPKGRITGRVVDSKIGLPLAGILVAAGGAQTLTSGDGSFILEGLPPGTHNLVIFPRDGLFKSFQQGALVAADSTTQTPVILQPAELVNIAFMVKVPEGTPSYIPIHLAGNITQLGNTFSNLQGGGSLLTSSLPLMARGEDGLYRLTLTLPVGADVRYKYTLGDGLWNTEHDEKGEFRLHQLIVPATDTQIEDEVVNWGNGSQGLLSFDVTVPQVTPPDEIIYIQFNPGIGWTSPIPMWPGGQNRWLFTLLSPLGGLDSLQYRYCRGDQCGIADDAQTAGPQASGRTVKPGTESLTQKDQVEAWAWYASAPASITVPNVQVNPRGDAFMAGIAFQSTYSPVWADHFVKGLSDVHSLGANWTIFTPTWTYTRQDLPHIEIVPGPDMDPNHLVAAVTQAKELGLKTALYPQPRFPQDSGTWFVSAPRDFAWWVTWFDHYRLFLLNFADLAQQNGVNALVLGGDWLAPALPHGTLPDGSPSMVPEDAETRWRTMIQEVRAHFSGTLAWALPYPVGVQNSPPFLDAVDMLYIEWSAALADQPGTSEADLSARAASLMDSDLLPFQQRWGKPLILAVSYPSVSGGSMGCLPDPEGGCLPADALDQPNPDQPNLVLDLNDQTNAYNALLLAVNDRPWISGFVSKGFYPPLPLQDKSPSLHGKPASGTLWFWFPRLLGK